MSLALRLRSQKVDEYHVLDPVTENFRNKFLHLGPQFSIPLQLLLASALDELGHQFLYLLLLGGPQTT